MLAAAAGLALALAAAHIASRGAPAALTFAWGRIEILAAQANGATLLVLGGILMFESVRRLAHPTALRRAVLRAQVVDASS